MELKRAMLTWQQQQEIQLLLRVHGEKKLNFILYSVFFSEQGVEESSHITLLNIFLGQKSVFFVLHPSAPILS